jgi:thiamine kinase-like enzyme
VPHRLSDVLAALGGAESEPVALDGGLTNRNYRVRVAGEDVVVRLPGAQTDVLGIDRAAERAATEAAAAAGVGPEVVAFECGCLVTRFLPGKPLDAAGVRAHLAQVAAALRLVHAGPTLPAAFNGFRIVEAYHDATLARGGTVPPDYDTAHALAVRIEAALPSDLVPCHNDLLPANLLWDGVGVKIVDWEYAGMGDRFFDLGNLAVNNGLDDAAVLEAYFGEVTPPRLAALHLMRLMSDFREAMWGVLQAAVSDLDEDFGAYAREHFDRLAAVAASSPIDRWLADAAA